MSDTKAECVTGESRYLTKKPIAVDKASEDQKLDYMSRLNFHKIYTVEHNVKVMDVGNVAGRSMPLLLGYWYNALPQSS